MKLELQKLLKEIFKSDNMFKCFQPDDSNMDMKTLYDLYKQKMHFNNVIPYYKKVAILQTCDILILIYMFILFININML